MSKDLIKKINDVVGGRVNYMPYDLTKIKATYGLPPVPIQGIEYVFARHDNAQTSRVMSLTSAGVFVSNKNTSGTIEFALLGESVSSAAIQAMSLTGIPFPIYIADITTGATGFVAGTACRLTGTPEWRRAKFPDLNILTFSCTRLVISNGLRLPA